MLYYLIAFFLALVPLICFRMGDGIRIPKEITSIIGLVVISGVALYSKRVKVGSVFKWVFALLLWCVFTLVWNTHYVPFFFSDKNIMINFPVLMLAWKPLCYMLISFFCVYLIASSESLTDHRTFVLRNVAIAFDRSNPSMSIKGLCNVVNWVVIVMCIYCILQALGLDNFFRATNNINLVAGSNLDPRFALSHRVVGTIGNPSILATWLAMCLPLSLYLNNLRGYVAIFLTIVVMSLTLSATSIIASIAATLFYLFFKVRPVIFFCIIALLILLSLFAYFKTDVKHFVNPTGRLDVYKESWNILKQRPLLGVGLGTFERFIGLNPEVVNRLGGRKWREFHNEYAQIWFAIGLIGLCLFITIIIATFVQFFKNLTSDAVPLMSSMIAFLIVCLTLFPMRIAPTSFYGVTIWGLLLHVTRRK